MPENNTAPAAPESNSGSETNPNLTVLPEPEEQGTTPGVLNKHQEAELVRARRICVAAQKPEYAPALAQRDITTPFITQILTDITTAEQYGRKAVACTNASRDATRVEGSAAETLIDSLRGIQAAARQKHLPERPDMLGNYYIGERLDKNETLLQSHAQNIINQANEERPPGVDTGVIVRVQGECDAVATANAAQTTEVGKGKLGRAERDALVESIVARRKKIQYAADGAWPPKKPASIQARTDFKLPANRPYSY